MKKLMTCVLVVLFFFGSIKASMEGFIIGGERTKMSQYPHSAFLEARCKDAGRWICGAAILNQRLLITAAHCVDECNWTEDKTAKFITLTGHENLRMVSVKRNIVDVRMHTDFDGKSLTNDIAVARLDEDLPLGPGIKRVIITKEFPNVTFGFVAGWGLINEETGRTAKILKDLKATIRSHEICSVIGVLHEGMFCAGSTEQGSDRPARGDSGSAMVASNKYHQIGLVSFCIRRLPALMVYTNISYYYDWIVEHAHQLYCDYEEE